MRFEIYSMETKQYRRYHWILLYESAMLLMKQKVIAVSPRAGYVTMKEARADVDAIRTNMGKDVAVIVKE